MPEVTDTRPAFLDHEELVRRRWLAGLNQSQLARRAGISKGQLSKIERGISGTSPETLASIASVLGCAIADFARQAS